MPRVSQQQARITRQRIIESALHIILNEGIDSLTFSHLANKANIARSGINGHFKKKSDIIQAVHPRLSAIIYDALDFSSPNTFYDSWTHAIVNNHIFRQAISSTDAFVDTDTGINSLIKAFKSGAREDIEKTIYMAMGYAIVHLPKYQQSH